MDYEVDENFVKFDHLIDGELTKVETPILEGLTTEEIIANAIRIIEAPSEWLS